MNRIPPQLKEPNYYRIYKNQDYQIKGKVGIFVSHLIMPEEMVPIEFHTLAMKTKQYIPWPFRYLFDKDRGSVMLDEEKFYEFDEFAPTKLVDSEGAEFDSDGVAYIEKYNTGLIEWVPPSETRHLDHGYFIMKEKKTGLPTVSSKLINKANIY